MRRYFLPILGLVFLFLGAAGSLFFFLKEKNPYELSFSGFAVFYSLVLLSVSAVAAFIGFFLRVIFRPNLSRHNFWGAVLREGVLFGFFTVLALILQAAVLLNLFTGSLLLLIFILIEFYVR